MNEGLGYPHWIVNNKKSAIWPSSVPCFKKHMKSGAHLLAPVPEDVKGGFVREIMLFLEGISVGGQSPQEREQHIIWQNSGHVFVCKSCGKKFKTNNSINKQKKLYGFKLHLKKSFCNLSMWGKKGGQEKDSSAQLHLIWNYIIRFLYKHLLAC